MTPQPQHPQRCETCKKRLINNPEDCPAEMQYEEMLEHRISVSDIELITTIIGCASHSSAGAQQRIEQFDEILTDVAIMADESSIVGRDSIKKTERIYHEGSLFAYERMIGYLQKKKEKALALLQAGDGK